jgi:hypothetical protein
MEPEDENPPVSTDTQVETVAPKAKSEPTRHPQPPRRVVPFKDKPVEPGETYTVSETKAKKMDKIPGQVRVTDEASPE